MARKFTQERLDELVEAATASERPYASLEGKPFNLSVSVARTLVVGSGLSRSDPAVREREAARIKRWLEAGTIGGKPRPQPNPKAEPPAIEIPEAVAEAVAEHAEKATRKRAPRKTGEASDTAKAIAKERELLGIGASA
jgi:hypothetical protein